MYREILPTIEREGATEKRDTEGRLIEEDIITNSQV